MRTKLLQTATVLSLAVLSTQSANSFCSCWNSTTSRAMGADCGLGIDIDSFWLAHWNCKDLCAEYAPTGYTYAYVDQLAFNACHEQHPERVAKPTDEQKKKIDQFAEENKGVATKVWDYAKEALKPLLEEAKKRAVASLTAKKDEKPTDEKPEAPSDKK